MVKKIIHSNKQRKNDFCKRKYVKRRSCETSVNTTTQALGGKVAVVPSIAPGNEENYSIGRSGSRNLCEEGGGAMTRKICGAATIFFD